MHKIYQFSTISALMAGYFEGDFDLHDVLTKKSFGIGCSDNINGELTIIEGKPWEAKGDKPVALLENYHVPFVQITEFTPENDFIIENITDKNLPNKMANILPTANIFLAVNIEAEFEKISIRRPQHGKGTLQGVEELAKTQKVDHLTNIKGSLVGFWTPELYGRISVPGFHFHFIDATNKVSGHVLSFEAKKALLKYQEKDRIEIINPSSQKYKQSNINISAIDKLISKVEN